MSRTLNQEINLNADIGKIYSALTDPALFGKFTGAKAEIDLNPGGLISLFDEMITGLTVEAIENTRLIQVWRAGNWEEGSYSLVKFDIEGDTTNTIIHFEHTGFPAGSKEHLEGGWHKMYWDPLKIFYRLRPQNN
jgi:activator of HSP90 ATPase